jgi:hypothetical protein
VDEHGPGSEVDDPVFGDYQPFSSNNALRLRLALCSVRTRASSSSNRSGRPAPWARLRMRARVSQGLRPVAACCML